MINLAPHSRLWIFQSERFLKTDEVEIIKSELDTFLPEWASHGNQLFGDYSVESHLFIQVGVDESKNSTSGCSIDALTRKVKEIGQKLNVDFFNRLKIAYEDSSTQIRLVSLIEFKNLVRSQEITKDTVVYNNLIETVADLDSNWRTKVSESWHNNLLITV